ncbi:MAG: hypothetical protein ACXABY_00685 [Candidatus Thorarchaeota archaeon]
MDKFVSIRRDKLEKLLVFLEEDLYAWKVELQPQGDGGFEENEEWIETVTRWLNPRRM